MNSWNLQIKDAKVIRLPQDWGHMLKLILATFSTEEIEERLFKLQEWKLGKNTSENQVNEKHFSTYKEVIQSKHMDVLMQIKSLQSIHGGHRPPSLIWLLEWKWVLGTPLL